MGLSGHLLLLLLLLPSAAAAAGTGGDGWVTIPDPVNNQKMQKLGRIAVEKSGKQLTFCQTAKAMRKKTGEITSYSLIAMAIAKGAANPWPYAALLDVSHAPPGSVGPALRQFVLFNLFIPMSPVHCPV